MVCHGPLHSRLCLVIIAIVSLVSAQMSEAKTPLLTPTLEVSAKASPAVLISGEKMNWSCQAKGLAEHTGETLEFQYSLVRVSHGHPVMTGRRDQVVDEAGNLGVWMLDDLAPQLPGVYEFQGTLAKPKKRVWTPLRDPPAPLAEIKKTFLVVHSPTQPVPRDSAPWLTIGTIQPADETLSIRNWLPKRTARLIPGLRRSFDHLPQGKHDGERVSLLESKSVFHAVLPVFAIGYPHLLTVRYPSGQDAAIRIDVGNSDDQTDAAISVKLPKNPEPSKSFPTPQKWIEYTLVFFPAGNDHVWITNPDPHLALTFDSIQVQAGPARFRLPGNQEITNNHTWLHVSGRDWIEAATKNWGNKASIHEFTQSSVQLYRMWSALDRLSQYAALRSCGGVILREPEDCSKNVNSWLIAILKDFNVPTLLSSGEAPLTAANAIKFSKSFYPLDPISSRHPFAGFVFPSLDEESFQQVRDALSDRLCLRGENDIKRLVAWVGDGSPRTSVILEALVKSNPDHLILHAELQTPQLNRKASRLIHDHFQLPTSEPTPSREILVSGMDPDDETAAVHLVQSGNQTWMTISNRAPWESNIQVTSSQDTTIQWNEVRSNHPLSDSNIEGTSHANQDQASWRIPACDTVTVSTDTPTTASDLTWTSSVAGGEPAIAVIKQSITSIVERIGVLSHLDPSGQLKNGSFENAGEMGLIGWLHAQYPPQCVVIDTNTASNGKQSVCLTTESTGKIHTWIVSETIPPPASGRMAVSMACRAAPSDEKPTHPLRVSIEATQKRNPHSMERAR